jgi:hypothetical protein
MARSAKAAPRRTPAVPVPIAPVRPKPWLIPAISVALLIPCFWQSRIQAGDLSSHIYNAWLARLISEGRAPGLALARQSTNVLFDLMLSALFPLGAAVAQRVAVSIAVLVFVWGAFAWASAVAGRRVWRGPAGVACAAGDRDTRVRVGVPHWILQFLSRPWTVLFCGRAGVEPDVDSGRPPVNTRVDGSRTAGFLDRDAAGICGDRATFA